LSDPDIYVYGAGSHGKVIAEAAKLQNRRVAAFVDDAPGKQGKTIHGLPIIESHRMPPRSSVIVGIGLNTARRQVMEDLISKGCTIVTVIHPSAMISPTATIAEGTFVGPLAVVHSDARVGRGCIVNSAAVIEHDCILEDWVHVSPGGTLGGEVAVGEFTHIGLNATILPRIRIGKRSMIGAGTVVLASLDNEITAVGVPARIVGPVKRI
jgi:sugar O-acyltransferase (sialic acid O-acetyltransferase NeuD family)